MQEEQTVSLTEEEEQMIALGDASEAILGQNVFATVVNHLAETYFQSFISTRPEDSEKREGVYAQYKALQDVIGTLRQFQSVRDQIAAKYADNLQEEMDYE